MDETIYNEMINKLKLVSSYEEHREILIPYFDKLYDDATYVTPLNEIAKQYFNQGVVDLGLDILIEIYNARPSPKRAQRVAERYYQYEVYDKAYYGWLERAKSKDEDESILLLEARLLNKLGESQQAIQKYRYLIKHYPTIAIAYEELGDIFYELNDYSGAETYYRAIYDYFDNYPNLKEIRLKLIDIELHKGFISMDEVEKLVEDSRLPIESAEEFYALATVYKKAFRYEEAIRYAIQALQQDKDNIDYQLLLMELYHLTGAESKLYKILTSLAQTLPLTDHRIVDIAKVAQDIGHINEDIVNKLYEYFQYSEHNEESYAILSLIIHFYLERHDAAKALHILKTTEDPNLMREYLSYLYAKVFEQLEIYEDVEYYYQTALDYLLSEKSLVYDFAKYYAKIDRLDDAIALLEKYRNSVYYQPQFELLLDNLNTRKEKQLLDKYKEWEEDNGL